MCNLFQRANTKRLHNNFLDYKIISLNDGELQTAQNAVLLEKSFPRQSRNDRNEIVI